MVEETLCKTLTTIITPMTNNSNSTSNNFPLKKRTFHSCQHKGVRNYKTLCADTMPAKEMF
jgi:hypothetical protein